MTKCIVLGEQVEGNKKKPIEFKIRLFTSEPGVSVDDAIVNPCQFEYVELVRHGLEGHYDTMFAHNGDRNGSTLLGYWNDGVPE